jgi:hypothetical protein
MKSYKPDISGESCRTRALIKRDFVKILLSVLMLLLHWIPEACVTEFIPRVKETRELLVVEGLITDQHVSNKVKLSLSLPFGKKSEAVPLGRCIVTIVDDLGHSSILHETVTGTYATDSTDFTGVPGRIYTLNIVTGPNNNNLRYISDPVEMKPVPHIDSLYYKKTVIEPPAHFFDGINGCNIYLDTHDPDNNCRYYRWDFTETWVIRLPFDIVNNKCWVNNKSDTINIKSTAAFSQSSIKDHMVTYVSNLSDKLKSRYSILVNQYSLTPEEYSYWEKTQNILVQTGGLYDIIPASIPSNLHCIENPDDDVLGYFSVSAIASQRLFIQDKFEGVLDPYKNCITDTLYTSVDPPGTGTSIWILFAERHPSMPNPPYLIITTYKGCADCTLRGTTLKPSFWTDAK